MRYFQQHTACGLQELFYKLPSPFGKTTQRELLRKAVGGLLYVPASNTEIAQIVISGKVRGLVSMAICLEDAVGDGEREACEANLRAQLEMLRCALDDGSLPPERLPLLFVRVKDAEMLRRLSACLVRHSRVLTGVILPKADSGDLDGALALADAVAHEAAEPFYVMPILESEELMLRPDRLAFLQELLAVVRAHPERVLNVRVGATDLCGLYGIRRRMDTAIHEIPVVAGCIADVVQVFGMGDLYTVSGPVCEFYPGANAPNREAALQGLLRETRLDLQSGILGKTCIHPSQLLPVQASYAVSFEDYQDAVAVLGGDQETVGVLPSHGQNKMNELRPHALWAQKMLAQATIYGVYREGVNRMRFLEAQQAEVRDD